MATKVANGLDLQAQRIVSVADPSAAQDVATKAYVDNIAAGLAWKKEVVVATTANGALATAFANSQTIDGYTLVTGDRILLKNQTTQTENGLYVVAVSGAPTRAVDANTTSGLQSATVSVVKGTVNKDTSWTQTADDPTVGTTNLVFAQFGAGNVYTAGNGLTGTTTFSVLANGSSIDVSSSGVKIADAAAGSGLTASAGVLNVGATTGITVAADTIGVDYAVTATRYSTTVGDGSSLSYVLTHGLTNKNVQVVLYETTAGNAWIPDVTARTTTTVTLGFAVAPTSSFFTAVIE